MEIYAWLSLSVVILATILIGSGMRRLDIPEREYANEKAAHRQARQVLANANERCTYLERDVVKLEKSLEEVREAHGDLQALHRKLQEQQTQWADKLDTRRKALETSEKARERLEGENARLKRQNGLQCPIWGNKPWGLSVVFDLTGSYYVHGEPGPWQERRADLVAKIRVPVGAGEVAGKIE
ncbi:MAG: hypothetical protein FWF59_01395 [Turicibacter sp.]|nr:hypothetical protein [Turicibacter sp.]